LRPTFWRIEFEWHCDLFWQIGFAMRISRASAYSIGALLQLAEAPVGIPTPCSRLAKIGEMPERFLLQVLRSLVNHGLLKSTRGVDGGYSLARPASEISLLQILEATDGPLTTELPPLECIPRTAQIHLQETLRQVTVETCRRLSELKLVDLPIPRPEEEVFTEVDVVSLKGSATFED